MASGADLIELAYEQWNPYYLGYAIDTGAETPIHAFSRDGGNHHFCAWNDRLWRLQAQRIDNVMTRDSPFNAAELKTLTTLVPSAEEAFQLHCQIIAERLGEKLDLRMKGIQ